MNEFLSKVFYWLFVGLLIAFGVGYYVSTNENLINGLFNGINYILVIVAEVVIAIVLSFRINKMKALTAKVLYLFYTALTGLTLATVFIYFDLVSILWILLATSVLFGIFAFLGKVLKIDLSKLGIYLLIALFGIIILYFVNMFLLNNTLNMIICGISLVVFLLYVAYDIHMITKKMPTNENMAIFGAFSLFLDFINIFLDLLQLFGNRD